MSVSYTHLDVYKRQELYDIDAVDKNIDFRRVKNLKVYFDNNAISLTTCRLYTSRCV